ncbi:cyclic nucleotide-binding domain-containing protein [Streptomyces sp. WAC 00631]|uniref:Crp/Fnr family transcriptional regulator n=1 Tax=unclassified Streptomyces TaxID=2593676 RepID=UPI000F777406|nr:MULTISPECIES: cyclic nucleotide-binding domain-containing protein [unclassified Streptomyces]MCC5033811.1 cyclic nucleotide-binding domain-containing protein [Streptomyces sp. WAC 00631]MCC9742802.1 cyclic nucleotide-binding domain-containing protein [Streptomyces sp. MNU89]
MTNRNGVLAALTQEQRERLMELSREVVFPAGTRIFEEGRTADRFWLIKSGSVTVDVHVPGRRSPTVETLGTGDLLGWSWLIPPRRWNFGAEALSPVRAYQFEAAEVLALLDEDPVLGRAMSTAVAGVVAHRLTAARTRLLDLYAPYGSGAAAS